MTSDASSSGNEGGRAEAGKRRRHDDKTADDDDNDGEERRRLPLGEWIVERMHFSWFTCTQSTGGIAILLSECPKQFAGLQTIGTIIFPVRSPPQISTSAP